MVRPRVSVECYAQARSENTSVTSPGEEQWSRVRYPKRPRHYSAHASTTSFTQKGTLSCEQIPTASTIRSHRATSYLIPGKDGSLKSGERLLNYVWYCNYAIDSPELSNLMTDTEGHRHRVTMPMGKLRPEVCAEQKLYAEKVLPAAFTEVVWMTTQPFVQCITDVSAPKAVFFGVSLFLFRLRLFNWRRRKVIELTIHVYPS